MKHDDEHRSVAEHYGAAIKRGGSCCGDEASASTVAALAGYSEADLAALPADALASSFGCGNPLAFSAVEPGQTVLDLGSGAGVDLILASRKVGPTGRVIGVDMTAAMLEAARANLAAAGVTNVELREGLIEALPVADASVDWVISNCVINLSPDKPRVFAEIARVLKPGGRVQVSDIVAEDLPAALRDSAVARSACLGGAISEAEYRAGLAAAGLADVDVPERLVYSASQLEDMVCELDPGAESAGCGCGCDSGGGGLDAEAAKRVAAAVEGKVWSARFEARKPL
ncbi:MAG: arsenite methyltransferase [Candidatus Krumholzibacteriia bacterium]|nr:arsenite methyltransferase [bacterium]MCB9513661.1 arsenite methyltransferase [Candidatus Latescibacterota bacterium]MCB9515496.1 arsenite methyltransferase [Candidatus Latescibacterota bacterium]